MAEFERTFDNVAENYDKIRPEYPLELYEEKALLTSLGVNLTDIDKIKE